MNLNLKFLSLPHCSYPKVKGKRNTLSFFFFHFGMCVCVCAQLCLTVCDTWTVAHQAHLSMRFPRKQSWGGFPFPSSIHFGKNT